MSSFTCITCRVAFHTPEIQRQHYKTDWHRYNLKRKVADLSSVTAEEFQRRVLNQREKDENQNKQTVVSCAVCKKSFSSENAYDNHLKSKKHKDNLLSVSQEKQVSAVNKDENSQPAGLCNMVNDHKGPLQIATTRKSSYQESDDSEIEEVDSDEWFGNDDDGPILFNNCLFCNHHSTNLIKNLKHMTLEHSFFIPDADYVVDMKGLITYLGDKVGRYCMCLWCNDRGRMFYTREAAQKHMQDKGHCKMLHEGEALAEYSQFYDYSSSYPDQADADEEVSVPVLDGSDYQLVLPSGSVVGHRSLMRYYRQNIDPSKAVIQKKTKVQKVLAQYLALGWTSTNSETVARKARDLQYMNRVQAKWSIKLGIKSNKLQKHFRPQVNF